jgi:hypothetical protein
MAGLSAARRVADGLRAKSRGKTSLMNAITVAASTGGPYPGETISTSREAVRVLRFSLEDDRARALKPALHIAGANLDNVEIFDGKSSASDPEAKSDGVPLADFSRPSHLAALKNMVQQAGFRIVIIDPINNYKGSAKHISEDEMRPIFQNLANLARELNVLVIVINHTNKKQVENALDKNSGSGAGTYVARVNYFLDKNPNDKNERLLADAGSNIPVGKTIVFAIEKVPPFELDGVTHDKVAQVKFLRYDGDITADSMIEENQAPNKTEKKRLGAWLEGFLQKAGADGIQTPKVKSAMKEENGNWNWDACRLAFGRLKKKGIVEGEEESGKSSVWKYVGPQKSVTG